jgi:hypothetical protein
LSFNIIVTDKSHECFDKFFAALGKASRAHRAIFCLVVDGYWAQQHLVFIKRPIQYNTNNAPTPTKTTFDYG